MKKYLLALSLITVASSANASERAPTVTLGGEVNTQYFVRNQKAYYNNAQDAKSATVRLNERGISSALVSNKNRVIIKVDGASNHGFKYGTYIRFKADTGPETYTQALTDKSYMYIESNMGRLEFGSNDSATYQMGVSAASIGSGTGGLNGDLSKIPAKYSGWGDAADSHFIRFPFGPFDTDWNQKIKKATYLSPKMYGFNVGISYIPDTEVSGTLSQANGITKTKDTNFKNFLAFAVNHEHKVGDFKFTEGLNIETAKAKKLTPTAFRHNLATWELGAHVNYKEFSVTGSYADWGKSATPKTRAAGRKYGVKYWTLGVQYKTEQFSTSATYMHSKRANVILDKAIAAGKEDKGFNTHDMLILGVDYNLAPGFLPYAEVGFFKTKHGDTALAADRRENKGQVYLFGTKLKF